MLSPPCFIFRRPLGPEVLLILFYMQVVAVNELIRELPIPDPLPVLLGEAARGGCPDLLEQELHKCILVLDPGLYREIEEVFGKLQAKELYGILFCRDDTLDTVDGLHPLQVPRGVLVVIGIGYFMDHIGSDFLQELKKGLIVAKP